MTSELIEYKTASSKQRRPAAAELCYLSQWTVERWHLAHVAGHHCQSHCPNAAICSTRSAQPFACRTHMSITQMNVKNC